MTAVDQDLLILFLDVFQNALMLLMALCVERVRIRPFRVCFAAFFGGAAALAARNAHLSRIQITLLWLPLALCMMRIACGGGAGARRSLRRALVLLACAGFLGGVVLALSGATGSLEAAHLSSGAFAGAVFVSTLCSGRAARDVRRIRVTCMVCQRELIFDAIADSGNSLRDYLTHRPVIVAGEALYKAIGAEEMCTRLIFADTAGGRQMMRLVVPRETALCFGGKRLSVEAALAFSPGLSKNAPALVPASLLDEGREADL